MLQVLFQFAKQHLDKPVKEWEDIVWSDLKKIELFGCHNKHCVWWRKSTTYHPKNIILIVKFEGEIWRWENHGVGLWHWNTTHY